MTEFRTYEGLCRSPGQDGAKNLRGLDLNPFINAGKMLIECTGYRPLHPRDEQWDPWRQPPLHYRMVQLALNEWAHPRVLTE